tara:strand:+ start:378 stop:929 length:552 start_codon:yes stop_codon:yes gene_type:complete
MIKRLNDWLRKVAERHNEWVSIAKSFNLKDYSEDIIQELYLRLWKYANEKKVIKNGVVSRGYMYFCIRSLAYQYHNTKNKVQKTSIDNTDYHLQIPDKSNLDEQEAFHKICTMIDNHIEGWHWYDRKLFQMYRDTNKSIRGIATQSHISWVSIFNTLKFLKKEIKEEFQEDWEDYKNKDYNRL